MARKKIALPKISKEIISLRKNDQKDRSKYIELHNKEKKGTEEYKKVVEKLIETDRSNYYFTKPPALIHRS